MTEKPSGIVFFDIDGTLVTGRSSGSFLAQRLGHAVALDAAEADYAAGLVDNHDVCVIDARGWTGAAVSEVEAWLDELPLIDGISETVDRCRTRNVVPVLASLAWDPVGAHLARRFEFAGHCGPGLEVEAERYTGKVARSFDEFDKRDFALRVCEELAIDATRCVAIGDSRSDLPLFEAVGLSIAFNATPDARAAASVALDSSSIFDAMRLVEEWTAPSHGSGRPLSSVRSD